MLIDRSLVPFICARCLAKGSLTGLRSNGKRLHQSVAAPKQMGEECSTGSEETKAAASKSRKEPGMSRMSERLAQMTEETIEQGGRGAEKAISEAGFSEELKKRLEARIQDGKFRNRNPAAFAAMSMPVRQPNRSLVHRRR